MFLTVVNACAVVMLIVGAWWLVTLPRIRDPELMRITAVRAVAALLIGSSRFLPPTSTFRFAMIIGGALVLWATSRRIRGEAQA